MEPNTPIPIERLLAEAGWARRLALQLVRDADGADDLVQETWRRALERPPRAVDGGNPRGWIRTVLRNLAIHRRRDELLRRAHEVRSEQRSSRDVDEIAQQLELQRELASAVLALREPYRTAIKLRYFDGLSPRELAHREGIRYDAARQRISRALALLRAQFESKRDPRSPNWRESFARFALPNLPRWKWVAKGLWMSAQAKWIVGAVVIALFGAFAARELTTSARPVELAASRLNANTPIDSPLESAAVASPARTTVDSQPLASAVGEQPTTAKSLAATIVAHAVDESGAPIAVSVSVGIMSPGSNPAPKLDCAPNLRADVACRFTFATEDQAASVDLRFSAPGYQEAWRPASLRAGDVIDLGAIQMQRAAQLFGRVVDVAGEPIADAQVSISSNPTDFAAEFTSRIGPLVPLASIGTSRDGSFEFDSIAPGPLLVCAHAPGTRFAITAPLEMRSDRPIHDLVLTLEPFARDEAFEVVIRSPDGAPFSGAQIESGVQREDRTANYVISDALRPTTDEHGRAWIPVTCAGRYSIRAIDPTAKYGPVERDDLAPGTTPIELQLTERASIAVRIRDREGVAVANFGARVLEASDPTRDVFTRSYDLATAIPSAQHPGGEATIAAPQVPFRVQVDAPGFELALAGPFQAATSAQGIEIRLDRVAPIRGRVLFDSGPLADAAVGLYESPPDSVVLSVDGIRAFARCGTVISTRTDAHGEFELFVRDSGRYFVRASKLGWSRSELGPLTFSPHVANEPLTLELQRGGSIEGRVLVGADCATAQTVVVASRFDGVVETRRADADGSFRFEHLTPGPWLVAHASSAVEELGRGGGESNIPNGVQSKPNCDVRDGEVTHLDLDLRNEERALVKGRLQLLGAHRGRWKAYLHPAEPCGQPIVSCVLSDDGRFEVTSPVIGDQVLYVEGQCADGTDFQFSQSFAGLRAPIEWQRDLRVGAVHVTSRSADELDASAFAIVWQDSEGARSVTRLRRMESQAWIASLVPKGVCRLCTWKNGAEIELARFEVKEGETTEVELP